MGHFNSNERVPSPQGIGPGSSHHPVDRQQAWNHLSRPGDSAFSGSMPKADPPGLMQQYYQMLLRWRWFIAASSALGCLIGLAIALPKKPVYRAHISLDIQSLNNNFLNMHNVEATSQSSSYSAESYIQTSIKLLQADSLSDRVVKRLSSAGGRPLNAKADLLTIWRHKFGFQIAPPPSRLELLKETAKSLKVKPLGLTRLVEATCDSSDPQMSADFCNMLGEEFAVQDLEIRSDAATKIGEWLTKQLADMRAKLEESEQKLQAYTQQNALFYNQSADSVAQEKLRLLQSELARAQADRMAKESQRELIQSSDQGALPSVVDNVPLKSYEAKLADLKRSYAELSTTLLPASPKLQALQAQIDQQEAFVSRERTNVVTRLRNDFEAARHREKLLGNAFNSQEKIVSDQVAKATQYNMLRREVESGRQIYETMLQRVKEAGLISVLRASPIRVVDPATPANAPFEPNPVSSSAEGLLAGAALGTVYASFRERIKHRLRSPGDSRMHLHVRELGVIPSSRVDMYTRSRAKSVELVTWQGTSLLAESFRATMNSLLDAREEEQAQVIVVSSPNSRDGKTTVICNLGVAFAETGRSVVIVDADLRRPRLHHVFDTKSDHGLSELLGGDLAIDTLPIAEIAKPTTIPGLSVITVGNATRSVSGLLHSKKLQELIARLRKEFDTVLIDTPPSLHLADARITARQADGTVIVLHSGVDLVEAESCVRMMSEAGTPVLGIILNHFNPANDARFRYYKGYAYEEQPTRRGRF